MAECPKEYPGSEVFRIVLVTGSIIDITINTTNIALIEYTKSFLIPLSC
jgi:hypothetical protein